MGSNRKLHKTTKKHTKKTNHFHNVLKKVTNCCQHTQELWSVFGLVVIPRGCSIWPIATDQTSPFPALTFPSQLLLPPSPLKGNDILFLIKLLLPKTSSPVNPLPSSALGVQPSLSFAFCPAPSQASPSSRTQSCLFPQQSPKPSSSRAIQQLRKGNTSEIRDLLSPQDLQTDRRAEETPPEPAAPQALAKRQVTSPQLPLELPFHSLWEGTDPGNSLYLASCFGFYFLRTQDKGSFLHTKPAILKH